ncbi:MAG: dTMP kinase [Planctomycetota bacterium]
MPFFVLEGPDGSGKSTQVRALKELWESRGRRVTSLREPGGTCLGDALRQILLSSDLTISPMAEAFLFNAARRQLVEEQILPALQRGDIVVCDRFWPSTVVYQCLAGGEREDDVRKLCALASAGAQPDAIAVLDVPLATTMARLGGKADRIESRGPDYLSRVRDGFLNLARREGWPVVDGSQPVGDVTLRLEGIFRA